MRTFSDTGKTRKMPFDCPVHVMFYFEVEQFKIIKIYSKFTKNNHKNTKMKYLIKCADEKCSFECDQSI